MRINKFIGEQQPAGKPNENDAGRNINACSCVELPAGLFTKRFVCSKEVLRA
jgi:hypothetical protein